MIELRDVTFTYRQADPTPASEAPGVRGIDLTVSDGRCVLVCGASGCGKTTITRLANGLAPAFFPGELSGQVLIDGEDCAGLESWQVAERVGSVFQNPRTQFFNVDSTGEVAFTLESMGWPEEKIRERTDATISELGLSTLADRSIFSLSGGQRQRIAYASAWAAHPRNLVLDEPTGNLDLESIRALRGYLLDAKRKGAAILVTEHRLWWLLNVVDEVVVMAGGGIAQRLAPVEFAALDSCGLAGLGLRTTDIREVRATSPRGTGNSPEPFLQARGLRARYGRQEVLHGVDLEVRSGETVALTGGNGAGKSTLARVLCGLHREQFGCVAVQPSSRTGTGPRPSSSRTSGISCSPTPSRPRGPWGCPRPGCRRQSTPRRSWTAWAWRSWLDGIPPRCRAGRSSDWPSQPASPAASPCSSSTSPPVASTW